VRTTVLDFTSESGESTKNQWADTVATWPLCRA